MSTGPQNDNLYIPAYRSLRKSKKTRRLMSRLNLNKHEAMGLVLDLWMWALTDAPDGDLTAYDAAAIAAGAEWVGDPDRLLVALVDAEFLDHELQIVGWAEGGGKVIKQREKARQKAANYRGKSRAIEVKNGVKNDPKNRANQGAPRPSNRYLESETPETPNHEVARPSNRNMESVDSQVTVTWDDFPSNGYLHVSSDMSHEENDKVPRPSNGNMGVEQKTTLEKKPSNGNMGVADDPNGGIIGGYRDIKDEVTVNDSYVNNQQNLKVENPVQESPQISKKRGTPGRPKAPEWTPEQEAEFDLWFEQKFWQPYPRRVNEDTGKLIPKTDKRECRAILRRLPIRSRRAMELAVKHYAESGQIPRDPIRFLRKNYWRAWIEVEGDASSGAVAGAVAVAVAVAAGNAGNGYGNGRGRGLHPEVKRDRAGSLANPDVAAKYGPGGKYGAMFNQGNQNKPTSNATMEDDGNA
jgi:hypothetical protein